jgi:hypothetical protein
VKFSRENDRYRITIDVNGEIDKTGSPKSNRSDVQGVTAEKPVAVVCCV